MLIANFILFFFIFLVSCSRTETEEDEPRALGKKPSSGHQAGTGTGAFQVSSVEGLGGKKLRRAVEDSMDQGLKYLRSQQKEGKWGIGGKPDPGITALAVMTFLKSPRRYTPDEPFIRLPLEYLASLAREDGSIYESGNANYVTSVAVQSLAASGQEKYRGFIQKAREYLARLQSDEEEGYRVQDRGYGGGGYGSDERPDLSNTSFWMEGLKAAGEPGSSESFQKALVFLNRCSNFSEYNKEEWSDREGRITISGNDGGGTYAPGDSKAGFIVLSNGKRVARSYGSMTYSLLKCYIFAGLKKTDPRVKAAINWVQENFTVSENPGFPTPEEGQQGLFYYFLAMAKALHLVEEERLVDKEGREHFWREELARKILSLQNSDGSWINKNDRWYEGFPVLATSYAVLSLQYCYEGIPGEKG